MGSYGVILGYILCECRKEWPAVARAHRREIWEFPKIGGPQYRLQNTIVHVLGNPKKATHNFGKHPCRTTRIALLQTRLVTPNRQIVHGNVQVTSSNTRTQLPLALHGCLESAVRICPLPCQGPQKKKFIVPSLFFANFFSLQPPTT